MNKLVVVSVAAALLALVQLCLGDIYFKRYPTSEQELEAFKEQGMTFRCVPGRTVIKFAEAEKSDIHLDEKESEEDYRRTLRSHMNYLNYGQKDESCKICVCSVEGQDEYCVRRPAVNVNECLVINKAMEEFNKNIPFSHDRDLSHMIRRDYIWHRDEIPYEGKAKCYRGNSYYTNNPKANDTDISQVPSDLDSILGYDNRTICYFCVCSSSGNEIACIIRDPYFCDYFRMLGPDESARDIYTNDFGEDRPAYFRLLSQRMRRTFDEGVYDLIETAGIKKSQTCVPFVSEYSDCSAENKCTGCTKCTCSADGTWECKNVYECVREVVSVDDNAVDYAFDNLLEEFRSKNAERSDQTTTSSSSKEERRQNVLVTEKKDDIDVEGDILALLREKRSLKSKRRLNEEDIDAKKINGSNAYNNTITFYHTVDELNEDTLQNTNISGTIEAKKVDINVASRRSDVSEKENVTFDNSLQIEYSKPQSFRQNIDNKIDSNHTDYGIDLLEQEKIGIITNHTQQEKNKYLSQIIVNELKTGSEYIGDKNAPVISNITFTPENDTLTAMAFIAGNLLNKLWEMEKEASDESLEIDAMRNEKIQDLLDLFKEPLTMRQEAFLKNALESLSRAMEKHKDGKNISICESLNEAKQFIEDAENMSWEKSEIKVPDQIRKNSESLSQQTPKPVKQNINAVVKAVSRVNDVLSLTKKYELVQKHLLELKNKKAKNAKGPNALLKTDDHFAENILENATDSLNLFGNILEKITKLLLPSKSSKKMIHRLRHTNMFVNKEYVIKKNIKDNFNADIGNTTLTMKDKIILDYLTKIKKNPRSLFVENSDEMPSPYVEKDILLNLSEIFKIKSLVDLVKLLDFNKSSIQNRLSPQTEKPSTRDPIISETEIVTQTTDHVTKSSLREINIARSTTETPKKFANTKEKFKAHFKTILDDLVELKKEAGGSGNELKLSNVFPCIYNILIGSNASNISNTPVDPYKKLVKVFDELKNVYHVESTAMTRRTNTKEVTEILRQTPRSAYVWERVVKNIDKQRKQNARRNTDIRPPIPLKELLQKLEHLDEISSSDSELLFKKTLGLKEKIIMLKAFHAENQRNLDTLKDIKVSLEIISSLPKEQQEEITDFVYNAANKINFHNKVLANKEKNKNLNEPQKELEKQVFDNTKKVPQFNEMALNEQEKKTEVNQSNKQIQLTRDAVMNQLIRNRINLYMKTANGSDNNPNYNIAKSILLNLDSGDSPVAKQLFKIFITTKRQNSQNVVNDKSLTEKVMNAKLVNNNLNSDKTLVPAMSSVPQVAPLSIETNPKLMSQLRRQSILEKVPLIHFEDPTYYVNNQFLAARKDQMLRKMLSIKNLNFF